MEALISALVLNSKETVLFLYIESQQYIAHLSHSFSQNYFLIFLAILDLNSFCSHPNSIAARMSAVAIAQLPSFEGIIQVSMLSADGSFRNSEMAVTGPTDHHSSWLIEEHQLTSLE
jgi:hypothetical protein